MVCVGGALIRPPLRVYFGFAFSFASIRRYPPCLCMEFGCRHASRAESWGDGQKAAAARIARGAIARQGGVSPHARAGAIAERRKENARGETGHISSAVRDTLVICVGESDGRGR